jgi:hypothetical protein
MGSVSKALKKIFKIWKLLSQMVKRLQAIEEALDELRETRFAIDGELAAERACAVEALAEEIVELEPYSTPEEVAEAKERVTDLQRRLAERDEDDVVVADAARRRRLVDVGQEELPDAPARSPLDSVD